MAETQQTMTEFTFAPGEKNIIGDRFSPSVIIFWLKTSIAASSTRIQYTTPNTLFGLIPLGVDTKTIPLRNVASVDTSTKFNLGSLVWGVVFLLIGLGCLDSSVAVCLCSISCCGFSHDDFSGLGRACRPRNGLNWMVLVSPPERTGKDYDQHAPSTVYPSFAAERGIRRVDRAENTCQRADGA